MLNAGHAAFWDHARAFNDRLHQFCDTLGTRPSPALLVPPRSCFPSWLLRENHVPLEEG
jgi:hypothetical protein